MASSPPTEYDATSLSLLLSSFVVICSSLVLLSLLSNSNTSILFSCNTKYGCNFSTENLILPFSIIISLNSWILSSCLSSTLYIESSLFADIFISNVCS